MKAILYSVVVGEYEGVLPAPPVEDGVRYILFTSDVNIQAPGWEVLPNRVGRIGTRDRCGQRVAKLQPMKFLPAHEVSVYIDANILVKRVGFVGWCVKQLGDSEIAAPLKVPRRGEMSKYRFDCLYAEGRVCIELGLDSAAVIERQMNRYLDAGFPQKYGLLENCVLVRRASLLMEQVGKDWTCEYANGSQRDECSLMYVLWNMGVMHRPLPIHARCNEWYEISNH